MYLAAKLSKKRVGFDVFKGAGLLAAVGATLARWSDWFELLKLRVAVCYKTLKLSYALRKTRVLRERVAQLEIKCGELFLGECDALVLDRPSRDVSDYSFDGVEHNAHEMTPNIVIGRQIVNGCMHDWFGQGPLVAWV